MRAQQEAFFKAMTGGLTNTLGGAAKPSSPDDNLETIKQQLAELQAKLNKMGK